MITTNDIQALIAFSILNNKADTINVMNAYGYQVPSAISDEDLFFKVWGVYQTKGLNELKRILSQVPINKSNVTQEEAKALAVKFQNANPNAKFSDWINNLVGNVGDFLGGHTDVVQSPTIVTQESKSVLPTWVVPVTAVLGISAIVYLFGKGIKNAFAISIMIVLILIVVIVYGIFAKETTLSQTGGGGTQTIHGGVGASFLNWVTGGISGLFGSGGGGNAPAPHEGGH